MGKGIKVLERKKVEGMALNVMVHTRIGPHVNRAMAYGCGAGGRVERVGRTLRRIPRWSRVTIMTMRKEV